MWYARHGWVGGTWARGWVAFDVGGTSRVFDISHNGSSADPTEHVSSLSGYTRTTVNLPASSRTSAENAASLIAAAAGVGVTITTDGTAANGHTIVVVQGGSNLVIPPSVDTRQTDIKGMWGLQRDNWDGVFDDNNDGGNADIAVQHVGNPGAVLSRPGRVIGVYGWGHTSWEPRIAVMTGPTFSTDPGELTTLAQARAPVIDSTGWTSAPISEAPGFEDTDDLWMVVRQGSTGGIRFRFHGESDGEGNGNFGTGQNSVQDATTSSDPTTAFGSTYTVVSDNNFTIYIGSGLIFEIQDSNGNYPADGAIDFEFGDHNPTMLHGTPLLVDFSILDEETTHHRLVAPQFAGIFATESGRGVNDAASYEDSKMAWYGPWSDVGFPPASDPSLIGGNELLGFGSATLPGFVNHVLASPVAIGTDVLGANAIISLGHNFVIGEAGGNSTGGDANDQIEIPVWIATNSGGVLGFPTVLWMGDGDVDRQFWHDDDPAANEGAFAPGVSEYRSILSNGATNMPYDFATEDFPATFDTTGGDSPSAVAYDRQRIQRDGLAVAA